MRVALCISGLSRCFHLCFSSLYKFLLNNPECQFDIFCHTWDVIERKGRKVNENQLVKIYNPKDIVVEEPIKFKITNTMYMKNNEGRSLNDMLSMFYKVEKCNELKSQYEKNNNFIYDAVIRFRFDIRLDASVPLNSQMNLSKLYVPKWGDFHGINDQFAYSNSSNMDKYCSLFTNFEKVLAEESGVNPEVMMKRHITQCQLEVERPGIEYILWNKRMNNYTYEKTLGFIK